MLTPLLPTTAPGGFFHAVDFLNDNRPHLIVIVLLVEASLQIGSCNGMLINELLD